MACPSTHCQILIGGFISLIIDMWVNFETTYSTFKISKLNYTKYFTIETSPQNRWDIRTPSSRWQRCHNGEVIFAMYIIKRELPSRSLLSWAPVRGEHLPQKLQKLCQPIPDCNHTEIHHMPTAPADDDVGVIINVIVFVSLHVIVMLLLNAPLLLLSLSLNLLKLQKSTIITNIFSIADFLQLSCLSSFGR